MIGNLVRSSGRNRRWFIHIYRGREHQ